jgi:uncharacterized membrane-anchored protein YitT (DUF2179 family)
MKAFKNILYMTIGCLISAFGISCFLLPNHLSSGGFAGIATIIYYLFEVPMGLIIIVLNIPIFILAYFKVGKKFIFKSLYSTILYSRFIDYFENTIYIEDKFLASIYGGIFIGVGLALVLKAEASTGGTDLIAYLMQGYDLNIKISQIVTIIDFIIIVINISIFRELEVGFYSFLVIFLIGKMIDIVFEGINFCKVIYIISDKHDEIMKIINLEMNRGATGLYGKGSYTNKNKTIIMCVSTRRDIDKIKDITRKIDSNSFIIISDAREVYGLGFKN